MEMKTINIYKYSIEFVYKYSIGKLLVKNKFAINLLAT